MKLGLRGKQLLRGQTFQQFQKTLQENCHGLSVHPAGGVSSDFRLYRLFHTEKLELSLVTSKMSKPSWHVRRTKVLATLRDAAITSFSALGNRRTGSRSGYAPVKVDPQHRAARSPPFVQMCV